MRSRDVNDRLNVQRASHPARPVEHETIAQRHERFSCQQSDQQVEQSSQELEMLSSPLYPSISTERIMRAVEHQKRITQELDDLCARQQQRAVLLRRTSVRLIIGVSVSLGGLALAFILLSLFRPDMLVRLLGLLGDTIAMLVALTDGIRSALLLIPANSWLLSGVALVIVLMVGVWLRLMRFPQEA